MVIPYKTVFWGNEFHSSAEETHLRKCLCKSGSILEFLSLLISGIHRITQAAFSPPPHSKCIFILGSE